MMDIRKHQEACLATWDALFEDKQHVPRCPQTEVFRFITRLEHGFPERPLARWDQCCGAGRKIILIARMGHDAFASDVSPTDIEHLQEWARETGLSCRAALTDMIQNPWEEGRRYA